MLKKIKKEKSISARSYARIMAMKSLYQHLLSSCSQDDALAFIQEEDPEYIRANHNYLHELLEGIWPLIPMLKKTLEPYSKLSSFSPSPVELSILLVATYELQKCPAVPYQVIINEAIEISKIYGGSESFRYINGILDQLHQSYQTLPLSSTNDSKEDSQISLDTNIEEKANSQISIEKDINLTSSSLCL